MNFFGAKHWPYAGLCLCFLWPPRCSACYGYGLDIVPGFQPQKLCFQRLFLVQLYLFFWFAHVLTFQKMCIHDSNIKSYQGAIHPGVRDHEVHGETFIIFTNSYYLLSHG